MADATRPPAKVAAREMLESLPDDVTWDDVIYRMYVRQKIEEGLADADTGNLISTDEVQRRIGRRNER